MPTPRLLSDKFLKQFLAPFTECSTEKNFKPKRNSKGEKKKNDKLYIQIMLGKRETPPPPKKFFPGKGVYSLIRILGKLFSRVKLYRTPLSGKLLK
jgi:hypothetical protein